MAGPSINVHATKAARALMRDTEPLARAVTAQFFKESPELLERYGERGRDKCLQDMRYNIEHLIPAVEMGDASMFTRYVEWLDGLLRARNVPTSDVLRCLELLRNEVFARYDKNEADAINAVLDAGIAMTQPR
jgi:hypothetical protein